MSTRIHFACVPKHASRDRSIGTQALRVLIAICSCADDAGIAYPSITTIQRLTDMKRQNVSAAVRNLEAVGYLHRGPGYAGGCDRPMVYRIIYADTASCPEMPPKNGVSSEDMTRRPPQVSSPGMTVEAKTSCPDMTVESCRCHAETCSAVISRDDMVSSQDMTPSDQTKYQTNEQTRKTHDELSATLFPHDAPVTPRSGRRKPMPESDAIDAEFNEWWQAVPKRVDKADAAKLYRQVRTKKRIPAATLLGAIQVYGRQFEPLGTQDPKFAAGPARWLRGEKWNDEPPPTSRPQAHLSCITSTNPTGRIVLRPTGGL